MSFFQSGTPEIRKKNNSLLYASMRGELDARFQLGYAIYKYSMDFPVGIERTRHLKLAQRLLYKIHRQGGRHVLAASTIYGSICYLEGDIENALFYWSFAAENGNTSAMYQLAVYEKKNRNRAQAINWLRKASAKGHVKSAQLLSRMELAPSAKSDLDPRGAELHIEEWMAHWGFHDAQATPVGPDGGFDVKSKRAAAQVKFRGQPTPLEQINSFHGACDRKYEFEIFVSKSGFTRPAREAANDYGMALFILESDGTPKPVNFAAEEIYRD